jgi:DNA repair ATPase RecN
MEAPGSPDQGLAVPPLKREWRRKDMSDRDVYVEKVKAKIDEWNADLAKLEAKSREAAADMQLKYEQQIRDLCEQRNEVEERLRELQRASDESWKRMREGMETAWDDMAKAFRDATDRFR